MEEDMATHSSIPAWRIPTDKPGKLQYMRLKRVGREWVTKHSTIPSKSIPTVHMERFQSLLWLNNDTPLCVRVCVLVSSIHLSIDGHLSCFYILTIVSMLKSVWGWICLFELVLLFSLDRCPEVKLLDHMIGIFRNLWGNSILFFMVAALINILINNTQGFPILHILMDTCYLSFWW